MSRLKGVTTVLVLCLVGLFAYGCGGDNGATQEQLDKAREAGAKEATEQAKMDQLQKQVRQLQKKSKQSSGGSKQVVAGSSTSYGTGPVSSCSGGVQVGPNTSCEFAMNVAGEYGSNPGASSIGAYSPVTGKYYTMSCGPWGSGSVCVGGNNASVYLP